MRDLNALPEFEFLVHYYELITDENICICNSNYKSERLIEKEFILNNFIHISSTLKKTIKKPDLLKTIAMSIEKSLIQIFPYFLRAGLRYFISSILAVNKDNELSEIIVKLARKSAANEKFVGLVEANFLNFPVFMTTACLANMRYYISPQIPFGMYPKSFHKKNFLLTLKDMQDILNSIYSVSNN